MKRPFRTARLLTVLIAMCVVFSSSAMAMTEAELSQLYLDVTEDAVAVFEPIWVDDSARVPNSGFFDFRKYKNWKHEEYESAITVPGNGMIVFCYAVLLTQTDKQSFSELNVSRATLEDRVNKTLRWLCLTSDYVDNPYPYPLAQSHKGSSHLLRNGHWARAIGRRVDAVGWMTMAVAVLGNRLDADTKTLLEKVLIGTAAKKRHFRGYTRLGGGLHDTIKHDFSSTVGAAYLFPERDDTQTYRDVITANAIGMTATEHDKACKILAEGKPVYEWSLGWNLYPDYSSDHHTWANNWYGCDMMFEARSYIQILSSQTGLDVPETFTYPGNGYDGVLAAIKVFCLPEGEPAWVHGMEYDSYYGAGLLAYCYGSVIKKDPVAAAFEERAARLLQRHTRAIRMYDYHRASWAKPAAAFLIHKYFGPRAEPLTIDEATRRLAGTYHYRWQQNLIHRSENKWASFSWGAICAGQNKPNKGPRGYVIPSRGYQQDIEPLVYFHPNSLRGHLTVRDKDNEHIQLPPQEPVYRTLQDDSGFCTTGSSQNAWLDQHYAFHSFDNGPCVLFTVFQANQPCRLDWSGLPLYFYVRNGMTGNRQLHDANGTHRLEQAAERTSSWWCVNDMLGMATVGGNKRVKVERSTGFNWARKPSYKDQCDGVFVSPMTDRKIEAGDVAVDLSVAIFPDTPHEQVAEAAAGMESTSLQLPEGWKGLIVPDQANKGKRYLAISNLYGTQTQAVLDLSFKQGAPILAKVTTVTGKTGSATLELETMESFNGTLELYAETPGGEAIRACKQASNRYALEPVRGQSATVRLRYEGTGAETFIISCEKGPSPRRISATSAQRSFDVELAWPTVIEIEGPGYLDEIGPSVEITDLNVRADGRVTVRVNARDQSGVERVELYCDGKPIGEKSLLPFMFTHYPPKGWQTFHVVATDASPARNQRVSFKRTIEVIPHTLDH